MAEISCGDMPKDEIIEEMKRIEEYGCKHVVMATRGSKGAFLRIDGKLYEQSPYLVEAVDTMAAGDSFITSFLINYISGMKDCVDFPEKAGHRGITTKEEYQDALIKIRIVFILINHGI